MNIKEILASGKPCFSFEFFPPKDSEGFDRLFETIESLKSWKPGYVSVTYGAGGSTRKKTIDLVCRIKKDIGIETMAHLTCVGSSSEEIRSILNILRDGEIENVLPLRGDPPRGDEVFVTPKNGFSHANELVSFIRDNGYDFCLGVAGYPEKHQEAVDIDTDLDYLKIKVDAGADFIITQLFFDNKVYFDFVKRARKNGIHIPILPGIMPIVNVGQIKRFTKMCGASIPSELVKQLERIQDDRDAVHQLGILHATDQCEQLLSTGAPGIHFYTLNRSKSTLKILENLKNQFRYVRA